MKAINKAVLVCKLFGYVLRVYVSFFTRNTKPHRLARNVPSTGADTDVESKTPKRNIVVVGAGFAGYHAARIIACDLPANSPFEVVVIEPNSHFNFTWVLPRFCVVENHEEKAFIPYGPYLNGARATWVQGKVASVDKESVTLGSGEVIPYEYLVIATGSGADDSLPSRVGETSKIKGVKLMQAMQQRIKASKKLVVVGGGATGVELATDAKSLYPEKSVTLIHSRSSVLHRFGPEMQAAGMKGLEDLGVEVILNDRLIGQDEATGVATLKSGKTVEYDYVVCVFFFFRFRRQRVKALTESLSRRRSIARAKSPTRRSSPTSRRTQSPKKDT